MPNKSDRFNVDTIDVHDLKKPNGPILTGVGFLDHMVDQLNSHAQIGISVVIRNFADDAQDVEDKNRHSSKDQGKLLSLVGSKIGLELKRLLQAPTARDNSRFCCPLDEALVECELKRNSTTGGLEKYNLSPFGKHPATGRQFVGHLKLSELETFWESLGAQAGLSITLIKLRGDNAHHIVESAFKAFSRALRNLLDGTDTSPSPRLDAIYGPESLNWQEGLSLKRQGSVHRKTKETSINTVLRFDEGKSVHVGTGVETLDLLFTTFAKNAGVSLDLHCKGDLWIDEHHTAEDVSIAVGQVLNDALGTKAGLNRMWCAKASEGQATVEVTMDLSNRPCFTHNLALDNGDDTIGDLSIEMFLHVLDSLVVNSRTTVHIVEFQPSPDLRDTVVAVASALGQALRYCASVDVRRSGATASSKGTLSV